MKNSNVKIWLAALALQLPPCVGAADNVTEDNATGRAPSRVGSAASADAIGADAAWGDDVSPAVGSLTLQWTLSGRRDPIDCGALGVERFDLSLNASPVDDDQWESPCDTFEISLDLPPGSYNGEAVLVDRFDRPVTLAIPVEQIDIVAGRNVVKSVDFPVAAFL